MQNSNILPDDPEELKKLLLDAHNVIQSLKINNEQKEKKVPVKKLFSSSSSESFIPVEIRDNEDAARNLSGLEIKIESNGTICIRIGREL